MYEFNLKLADKSKYFIVNGNIFDEEYVLTLNGLDIE